MADLSLNGLSKHYCDFYAVRYPYGRLGPAVATDSFTIVGTGSGPGL